jgi:hypothetical protein
MTITTIPRNHKRKIEALKLKLTVCKLHSLGNNFVGADIDPKQAWKDLYSGHGAKLTDQGDGKYVIQVHSNLWYELTAPADIATGEVEFPAEAGPVPAYRVKAGDIIGVFTAGKLTSRATVTTAPVTDPGDVVTITTDAGAFKITANAYVAHLGYTWQHAPIPVYIYTMPTVGCIIGYGSDGESARVIDVAGNGAPGSYLVRTDGPTLAVTVLEPGQPKPECKCNHVGSVGHAGCPVSY